MPETGKTQSEYWWKVDKEMLAALLALIPGKQTKVLSVVIGAVKAPYGMVMLQDESGRRKRTTLRELGRRAGCLSASEKPCSINTVKGTLRTLMELDIICNYGHDSYLVNPEFLCQGNEKDRETLARNYAGKRAFAEGAGKDPGFERISLTGKSGFEWWTMSRELLCELLDSMPGKQAKALRAILESVDNRDGTIGKTQKTLAADAGCGIKAMNEVIGIMQGNNTDQLALAKLQLKNAGYKGYEGFEGFICSYGQGKYMVNPTFLMQGKSAKHAKLAETFTKRCINGYD